MTRHPAAGNQSARHSGEGAAEGAAQPRGAARPDEAEMARARAATAAGKLPGTTHDPNSVTTMTEAEPKGDVYPPKRDADDHDEVV